MEHSASLTSRGPAGPAGPCPDDRTAYQELIARARAFQDALAAAAPGHENSAEVASLLANLTAILRPHAVDEDRQLFGRLNDVPGYGQSLCPPLTIDEATSMHVRGRVTFTRFHLGGGGAVHGGVIAMFFDSLLGRLVNPTLEQRRVRTARLEIDYRHVVPVQVEAFAMGRVVSIEGRKRRLQGSILIDGALCASAEGLFVELQPGQA